MKSLNLTAKVVLLFAVLVMIPSCAVNPVTGKRQIMFMSEAQEVAMGQSYDPQVLATFGVYPDQKLQNYVQQLVMKWGRSRTVPTCSIMCGWWILRW